MKISHDWLRGFVPHALTPAALGELLSRHVVTLDGVSALRADLGSIVVARVIESERVPDTKLSFNKVDDGTGTLLEVVCGAPNVAVGALYPFARSGTVLPDGKKIEKRKIRGFTSNGMLCSARELGLGDDHEGILALAVDVPTGTPLLAAMPIGDTQLDLDVLPNRPDLLSHLGVSREVAALVGLKPQLPPELRDLPAAPAAVRGTDSASADGVTVTVADPHGCPRYVAAVIRGLKVGPSPAWLVERLAGVGARSINNVVDATNYVLHGLGQPVHAFDLAKLSGRAIVVRRAKAGEQLATLDGESRTLQPWMTIIADGARATALAGVMGGKESEVTDATTDVLLEVACFAPADVRKVRRALGLSTDASYRFERGVDGASTDSIARLAAGLIASVAGGTIASLLDVGVPAQPHAPIRLDPQRVNRLLGAAVPTDEITRLLADIGFSVKRLDGGALAVVAPAWRHDVARDVDLVEEIARLRGYDTLPDDLRPYRIGTVPDHPQYLAGRRVRSALVAAGLAETRPMPFTRGDATPHVRVMNPLAEDEPFLRTTLLETLTQRAEHNLNQHHGNVRLFEIGDVFTPVPGAMPREELRAAALVLGDRRPSHFTEAKPPQFDAWDVKAIAEEMARAAFPGGTVVLDPAPVAAAEGSASGLMWNVLLEGRAVGDVRELALDAPVWASPAFGVEITLGAVSARPRAEPGSHAYALVESATPVRPSIHYEPLPTTPAAEFDLSLLVPDTLPSARVEQVIRRTAGELLESLVLFDQYTGAGVPAGSRSLAWRLTFRHPERTLREKEIDGRRSQLLKTLETELGVVPRTA